MAGERTMSSFKAFSSSFLAGVSMVANTASWLGVTGVTGVTGSFNTSGTLGGVVLTSSEDGLAAASDVLGGLTFSALRGGEASTLEGDPEGGLALGEGDLVGERARAAASPYRTRPVAVAEREVAAAAAERE